MSVVFSDEEITEEVRKPASKVKKPRKSKTPPQKKKPKAKQDPVVILTSQDLTPSYSLRVLQSPVDRASPTASPYSLRSTSRINYSSDEEADFSSSSVSRVVKETSTTRMGLSEARFHNQIADIEKRKYTSSTPAANTTTTSTRSKRRRNLDNNRTLETTTTTFTRKTAPQEDSSSSSEDVISGGTATEEEEVVTIVTKETEKPVDGSAWHDISWREIALAGFLASVGVLGYICYASDVCGYC